MGRVDEYLEKKGTKHLMALVTVFYIVGTVIFNIYLRSLGVFEFELIQLRYVFVGLVFSLFTFFVMAIAAGGVLLYRTVLPPKGKKTKKQKAKENSLLEGVFFVFLVPWVIGYALYVFPEVPSGFGGAKPIMARLIGEKETILKINSLIAHETGIGEDKLPFEMVSENTNLAIGANVKILDRNRDRILLILTKELYLSSTSKLAKNLIEAGTSSDEIQTEETKNFIQKSLLVKADKIESITFSLYEPPEILTKQDLEIASQVLSEKEEQPTVIVAQMNTEKREEEKKKSADIVEKFIVAQVPESAPQILEAVRNAPKVVAMVPTKQQEDFRSLIMEERGVNTEKKDSDFERIGVEIQEKLEEKETLDSTLEEEVEIEKEKDSLESVLSQFIDTKFIDYRAEFYRKASELHEREKFSNDKLLQERFLLAKKIAQTFRREYAMEWNNLADDNYLAFGQTEKRFPWKLMEIFRGAESISVLVERINTTKLDPAEIQKQEAVKAIIEAQEDDAKEVQGEFPEESLDSVLSEEEITQEEPVSEALNEEVLSEEIIPIQENVEEVSPVEEINPKNTPEEIDPVADQVEEGVETEIISEEELPLEAFPIEEPIE